MAVQQLWCAFAVLHLAGIAHLHEIRLREIAYRVRIHLLRA